MKYLLEKIIEGEFFSQEEAILFIESIDKELLTPEQISGIMIGIQMRGLQLSEVKGFRKALLSLSVPVMLPANEAMDLCGTGGDGKNTFNISTTTSLILAAMGKKVIKHGNYGVSSLCGSSNVLEALGFNLNNDAKDLEKSFKEKNLAILHAPLFHPALKKAAAIRRNLGIKTLFNALGPLVNPAQPKFQMTGTFSLELAKIYQHVLKNERTAYSVMYGMNGYDELTLTDTTRVFGHEGDSIREAKNYGTRTLTQDELLGGEGIEDAAKIVRNVTSGKGTEGQNIVLAANVAEALRIYDGSVNTIDAFKEAMAFIKSGQTAKHFNL